MTEAIISASCGKLKGIIENDNNLEFLAFKGIPYAKSPIGELRFQVMSYSF